MVEGSSCGELLSDGSFHWADTEECTKLDGFSVLFG